MCKMEFDDDTIAKCVNEITSSNSKPIPVFTTLSQTGLHIPISAGHNRRRYFNDSIDESFNTYLDLRVNLEAILANSKFNMRNQKPLSFNTDTILLQYDPQLHFRQLCHTDEVDTYFYGKQPKYFKFGVVLAIEDNTFLYLKINNEFTPAMKIILQKCDQLF